MLLLDEPTTGLDAVTSLTVAKALRELARAGARRSRARSTSRRSGIAALFDDLLLLWRGRVAYDGAAADTDACLRAALGADADAVLPRADDDKRYNPAAAWVCAVAEPSHGRRSSPRGDARNGGRGSRGAALANARHAGADLAHADGGRPRGRREGGGSRVTSAACSGGGFASRSLARCCTCAASACSSPTALEHMLVGLLYGSNYCAPLLATTGGFLDVSACLFALRRRRGPRRTPRRPTSSR